MKNFLFLFLPFVLSFFIFFFLECGMLYWMKDENTKRLNHIELVIVGPNICLIQNGIVDITTLQQNEEFCIQLQSHTMRWMSNQINRKKKNTRLVKHHLSHILLLNPSFHKKELTSEVDGSKLSIQSSLHFSGLVYAPNFRSIKVGLTVGLNMWKK